MTLLEPFCALRAAPEHATSVAAPPYDVVDTEEARRLAGKNSRSFLHVSKPEIDFAPGADSHSPEVYAKGRENLERLITEGCLLREASECFYLYRLIMGEHSQVGLVGAASVEAYRDGRIKRHEHTQPKKVADRAANADALDAHTGTLFLTYGADADIDSQVQTLTRAQPEIDFVAADGIRHSVWVVSDAEPIERLGSVFNAMPAVYIADGHHRCAAAAELQRLRRAARERGERVGAADRFLTVLFPDDQVRILAYNRVVRSLGKRTPEQFVTSLNAAFVVQASAAPVDPEGPGIFGLYTGGNWYRLQIRPELVGDDALGRLDINLLEANCLAPLLGISDQRNDSRIDFVGGIRGLGELERRVDSGEMAAAFSLFATQLADVFAVADRDQVMPTKSTWFEPKLRDGLLILPLD